MITALSFSGSGQITYFSYGWTGDTASLYDTAVAPATLASAGAVAATLGAQGYIITAMGGDETNGLLLVGTRVHGDTLPRPTLVATHANLIDEETGGYAVVGTVEAQIGDILGVTQIGQR